MPAALRLVGLAAAVPLALLLAACAQTTAPPTRGTAPASPLLFASDLRCGDRALQFGIGQRDGLEVRQLAVGARRIDMKQVVSASGARYEGIDEPRSSVWSKGTRATVVLDGETLPECHVINPSSPPASAATTGGSAAATFAPLTARGNEPAWTLTLDRTLRFTTDGRLIEGRTPAGQMRDGVRRYEGVVQGRAICVAIREQRCVDTMSGMNYPRSVEVLFDGRTYRGCGGNPAELLTGGEWVVEEIGGGGIIDRSRATLYFRDDGRLAGRASCNSYTGTYALTGESLTIGKAATTMMACPPSLMAQEQRFLEILQQVQRFEISATGALVLIDRTGRTITARRG